MLRGKIGVTSAKTNLRNICAKYASYVFCTNVPLRTIRQIETPRSAGPKLY